MNYNHVSADIETLDTKGSAVVLSVGLAKFNLEDEETYTDIQSDKDRLLYFRLDMKAQQDAGRTINSDTVSWWMDQSVLARQVFQAPALDIGTGLALMTEFCQDTVYLWGNGNTFDNIILRSLYDSFDKRFPYHFTKDMDLRTLRMTSGKNTLYRVTEDGDDFTEHNALHDAIKQAVLAQNFWRTIYG